MESRSNDDVNLDQDDSKIETDTTTTTTTNNNNNNNESLSNTIEVIPLMSEELDVIKTERVDEAIITKEPVKETKTEQIPIMHEELIIERRPVIDNSPSLASNNNNNNNNNNISTGYENEEFKPVGTNTQIKIPLKREEVEVTKKSYVKEELVIRKKEVTKTQTVSEEIITERVVDPQV
jgi:stress response protein YsnF